MVFRHLYPECELLKADGRYAVMAGSGLLVADSIGALCQMIADIAPQYTDDTDSLRCRR